MPFPMLAGTLASAAGSAAGGSLLGSLGASFLGKAAGGLGSLVGGLFGGGKKRGPDESDLRAFAMHQTYDHFRNTIGAAKENGIHPLTALGLSPTSSGYATASSGGGTDYKSMLSDAGADIGRALSAGTSNAEKLQERLLLAQIQGQEIDNASRASMLARSVAMPGSPPGMPSGAKAMLNSIPTPIGSADGMIPLHTMGYDENGTPIRFFNTNELGDNELAQAFHTLRYTVPDFIQGTGRSLGKKLYKKATTPFYKWFD